MKNILVQVSINSQMTSHFHDEVATRSASGDTPGERSVNPLSLTSGVISATSTLSDCCEGSWDIAAIKSFVGFTDKIISRKFEDDSVYGEVRLIKSSRLVSSSVPKWRITSSDAILWAGLDAKLSRP